MINSSDFLHKLKIVFFVILISQQGLFSRTVNDSTFQHHEITIYVIKSVSPIDWSNPSNLYKSTFNCFINAALKKNYYVIGHTLARINSTLLPTPRFAAMTGAKQTEKVELVLIKKTGFGAFGSTVHGKMEPEESIKRGIGFYSKRNTVAFIKFRINENSAKRILQFIDYFSQKTKYGFAPCELYNGSTWPRYENEGSGCSGFGMAVLDVAHLLPAESNNWMINVKIPMDLIGGEFNHNKKIKISSILHTKSWYIGTGTVDVDYINYKVYDPNYIFDWIINKRSQNDPEFLAYEEDGIPGLIVDRQNLVVNDNEPICLQRTDSNLFIRHYYRKIQTLKSK
jgi:hypothetical protein